MAQLARQRGLAPKALELARPLAEALLGAMEARCFNGYLGGESFVPGDDAEFLVELVTALLGVEVASR